MLLWDFLTEMTMLGELCSIILDVAFNLALLLDGVPNMLLLAVVRS